MSPSRVSLIAAIAMMVVWGTNFAFVKHVLGVLGVGPFLFVRFLAMPVCAFALLALATRGRLAGTWPRREDLPRFIACGLIGHALHVGLVFRGIDLSTAFSSALVLTSGPLFTLFILAALGAERLHPAQIAGTLVALAGIVVFLSDKFMRGVANAGLGDGVLLAAAAAFSLYTVMARPITERYGALVVLAYTLLFGAPLMLLLSFPSFARVGVGHLTPMVWLGLFWSIVLSSVVGWAVWGWVNAVRGVARSAPLMYLPPPIAGVVAWLTLGEHFTPVKIVGAVVTMAGVAWAQFGGGHPPPREAAQPDSG